MWIHGTGLVLALSLLPTARATAQPGCDAPDASGADVIRSVVHAVNDGRYPTLRDVVNRTWGERALKNGPASEIVYELGAWHWRSRVLHVAVVCAVSRTSAYALLRNDLSEEIDSLNVTLDSTTNRISAHAIRAGVRVFVAPSDIVSDSARVAAIRRLTHRLSEAGVYAGNIIFAKNGRWLYADSVGQFDRERKLPTRFSDQYSIGSMGKLFTATAIMDLVERGKLRLDDTLGLLLPDSIRGPERDNYFRVSRQVRAVPLKYVLSHTSGIEPGRDSLSFTPGSRFSYCNFCYFLLGRGLERFTGTPLEEYYRRVLFQPAGMEHTERVVTAAALDRFPPNYMVEYDSSGFHLPRNALIQTVPANGAGNFFSTATDIFRFGEALRTGKLVPLRVVQAMRTAKTELGAPEYGYGVIRWYGPGVWGHAGGLPGVDADLELFGDSGYMLVTLSNVDGVSQPIRRKVIALLNTRSQFGSPSESP